MKTNDVVFQEYQGIRRYGVVINETVKEDRWKWIKVKWFNDDVYESAMQNLQQLRGGDHTLKEYRIDQVRVIDPSHEVQTLLKCVEFTHSIISQ